MFKVVKVTLPSYAIIETLPSTYPSSEEAAQAAWDLNDLLSTDDVGYHVVDHLGQLVTL